MKINKFYKLLTLVCLALFCFSNITFAQTTGTEVKATVVDEEGNPINGVQVFGPKGAQTITNENGQFQIKLLSDESVVIQKKGYESELISMSDLLDNVTLRKSLFLASEDDEIEMGVATKDKRDITGAISSINTKDRLKYDNTQWVRDYINGLMLGVKGSSNIRGLGNAVFVIDGVIGRDPNILNMEEVEQITVLKDANSVALYGSQGRNGVIIINTKRGQVNKKVFNVNIRSGIKDPIALPNYLGSLDYMELFNEARMNDGQDPSFGPDDMDPYRNNPNKYRYPDVDFYSNEYVKPFITSTSIITEFAGGNDKSTYYVNLGWNRNESLVSINPGANAGDNRFNVRGNIDFRVNDWITSSLDGIAIISSSKSALADLLEEGTTFKPNSYVPLIPVSMVDTIGNPALASEIKAARIYNGMLLGGTQQFQSNTPVAESIAGGYQNNVVRSTQFNNAINFNLDRVTEGLSARTYLSFDFYDSYKLSNNNDYKIYEPEWTDDKVTGLTSYGNDLKDLTENVSTNNFVSRIGFYALVNYDKTFAEKHSLNGTFLGFYNSLKKNNVLQTDIDSHLGFQLVYDYKKKMFFDFSGTYVSSIKLPEGNRGGFSPTLGLGYILSEESFLKDSNVFDYLKVKASGGVINSDQGIDEYYLYSETYSNGGTFNWADGQSSNRKQSIDQGENLNMGYEQRIDFNVGFESYLWNSLWLEFNYFRTELDKQLTFLNDRYPSYYNTFRPYDNYNKNKYTGFELGLNYDKSFNDFTLSVGANILYNESKAVTRSEIYEFDYQYRAGKETSTIFGLVDQGFYSQDDFDMDGDGNYILKDGLAVPNFGAVQPGDIKYMDKNGDNIIDNDDNVAIGQSSSPWTYGINLNLNYKSFNLFILGTGQFGADAIKSNSYYQVNGNDKYSEVVLGRWTPETADTATFPRLSSGQNQNNFRNSTFWLYDTSFFKINRAQLTFDFDDKLCENVGMKEFSINLSGTNLFEIAENRDIRQLSIGGSPQFRAFMLGLRMSF